MVTLLRALGLAALLAACTTVEAPPTRDAATCVALFERFDRIERYGPQTNFNFRTEAPPMLPPALGRQAERLRRAGCITRSSDLDAMTALGPELADYRIVSGGAAIRPVPVHLGIVTGFVDEARATEFFRRLGYRSRGIGVPTLGRRIYIGPFDNEAGLEQALALAREAGFIAPYPATQTRF